MSPQNERVFVYLAVVVRYLCVTPIKVRVHMFLKSGENLMDFFYKEK